MTALRFRRATEQDARPLAQLADKTFRDTSVPGKRGVEILRFYVDSSQHGKGVAYRLMDELAARATALDAEVLWLCVWDQNAHATAFYKRCRFATVGTTTFRLGAEVQSDWVMSRDLRGA